MSKECPTDFNMNRICQASKSSWPKQQRCKVSNSLKVWSKPHAFIQSTTNLAYCFLNDRGLTIRVASLAPQCSPILVNPLWWWTCIWLYELPFQGVPFQVSMDYITDQHSSNCCFFLFLLLALEAWKSISEFHPVQRHWSAHVLAHFVWWPLSPSAETLITCQHLLYGCHFTF